MVEPPALAPTVAAIPLPPREALHTVATSGYQHVQLSATQSELRPRELDRSARRDLVTLMRRLELTCAGIDFLIPPEHYLDPARADRAVAAAFSAIDLAGDMGRVTVTVELPAAVIQSESRSNPADLLQAIIQHGQRVGVVIANLVYPALTVDGLGVAIDIATVASKRVSASAALTAAGRDLASVRCSGATEAGARIPFGPISRIDPLEVQVALSIAGYQDAIVLDARGWPDVIGGLRQSATAWSSAASFGIK